MTATRIPSSSTSLPPGWKDVVADFGAVGDGTTDDRAAFQSAHNWAKANNGTIFVPSLKTYAIYPDGTGKGIVLDSWGWRWMGAGPGGGTPRLLWMGGAGTGPMVSIPSNPTGPWEFERIRLSGNNSAFDGTLMEIFPGVAGDVQQWSLHDCDFDGFALAGLKIQKVVSARIDNCRFQNVRSGTCYGLWIGNNYYANVIQVTNCMFAGGKTAHIYADNNDAEMFNIGPNNTFEAGVNTPALLATVNNHFYNLYVNANWCGDASGTVDWFQVLGDVYYCATYIGNTITNGDVNSHGFVFGNGHHFLFGNMVLGAANNYAMKSSTGASQVTDVGNQWQSVGAIWDGSYGSWWQFTSSPGTFPTFPPPLFNPTGQLHASGFVNDLATAGVVNGQVVIVDRADAEVLFSTGMGPVGTVLTLVADTAAGTVPPFIVANTGVTVNAPQGQTNPRFKSGKSVVQAWQQATNVWYLWGDLQEHRRQYEFTASYTFVLSDDGDVIVSNAVGAVTFTVPPNSAAAFPVGAEIDIVQAGAGQVTFAPGAGVTLHSRGALLHTSAQYGRVKLLKRATDEWVISGDLS